MFPDTMEFPAPVLRARLKLHKNFSSLIHKLYKPGWESQLDSYARASRAEKRQWLLAYMEGKDPAKWKIPEKRQKKGKVLDKPKQSVRAMSNKKSDQKIYRRKRIPGNVTAAPKTGEMEAKPAVGKQPAKSKRIWGKQQAESKKMKAKAAESKQAKVTPAESKKAKEEQPAEVEAKGVGDDVIQATGVGDAVAQVWRDAVTNFKIIMQSSTNEEGHLLALKGMIKGKDEGQCVFLMTKGNDGAHLFASKGIGQTEEKFERCKQMIIQLLPVVVDKAAELPPDVLQNMLVTF